MKFLWILLCIPLSLSGAQYTVNAQPITYHAGVTHVNPPELMVMVAQPAIPNGPVIPRRIIWRRTIEDSPRCIRCMLCSAVVLCSTGIGIFIWQVL